MKSPVYIRGAAAYLPGEPVTNDQLHELFGLNPEWIDLYLGIKTRYASNNPFTGENHGATSDLSTEAARQAIEASGFQGAEIDLVILSTATPDYPLPATVNFVVEQLGLPACAAMEIRSGCCGIVQALVTAQQYLWSGEAHTILVIGSEVFSAFLADLQERGQELPPQQMLNLGLFGDGAGAVILSLEPPSEGPVFELVGGIWRVYGSSHAPAFLVPAGGSRRPITPEVIEKKEYRFVQNYKEIQRLNPQCSKRIFQALLEKFSLESSQLFALLPHQPSIHLMRSIVDALGFPRERVFTTVTDIGHTGSAAALIELAQYMQHYKNLLRMEELPAGDEHLVALISVEATKWIAGACLFRFRPQANQPEKMHT